MPKHYIGHEFEALRLRYEDQVELLRELTKIDHRMVTAFFTLQLALGAWLVAQEAIVPRLQWGLAVIDIAVASIFLKLLYNNHCRRQEVADTIANVNEALGFKEVEAYLDGKSLNPEYTRRYWFEWYVAAVVVSTVGVFLCLRSPSESPYYHVVHGWPILSDGYMLGQATGVGIDSRNHVFVFHRAGREWTQPFPIDPIPNATIAVFDGATGQQVAAWGANTFVMPHGLTIDAKDNVWLTDVGRHQIYKFTPDGHLLFALGEAGVPGDDRSHFNLPTDVAVLPDGSFYVSDGYANTRVVKYSAEGEFLFQWGTKGSGPGQFDLPHGIAVDRSGRVYVADRGNARIQIFDSDGKFLAEWKDSALGRPYAVAVGSDAKAFLIDGGDQPPAAPDRSKAFRLSLDGKIETTFGRFGNYDGQFVLGHDIAVAADGAVYIVDAWGMRVQKFVLR